MDNNKKNETAKLELKLYHLFVGVMGVLLLSVVGYIAINAAHIPVIDEHIANIDQKVDEGFKWQSQRLDDHEQRIRSLEHGRNR
jgi:hypothetical protein